MTPHEKAVDAINRRLERLQANLRVAESESAQQFLLQSIIATLGVSDAFADYIRAVGTYAQRRHGEFKQASATVGERHGDLLKSGKDLLEQLKANPTDRALRKEIKRAQRNMEGIQKGLRREAFSVQRELSFSMATVDQLAESIRRLVEADQSAALARALNRLLGHVRELYSALKATLPAKNLVDVPAWECSALGALGEAKDFYDAYARAGHQAVVALEVMTMAVSDNPPATPEETTRRANEAVATRLKGITARFTSD